MPAPRLRVLPLLTLLSLLPVMAWAAGPQLLHFRSVSDGTNRYDTPKLAVRGDTYWTASAKRTSTGVALPAEVSRVTVGGVQLFRTKLSLSVDTVAGLEADAADNVYLAGSFFISSNAGNLVKLDRTGRQLWTAQILPPDNGSISLSQLALDAQGNPFVAGSFLRGNTTYVYVTRLQPDNGQVVWGFTLINGNLPKLAIGGDDNPIVAFGRSNQVTVAKVSGAGGTLMWSRLLDSPPYDTGSASVPGLVSDASGSPIVNHCLTFPEFSEFIWYLRKLSPAGVVEWTSSNSGLAGIQNGVRLAPDGSIRVLAERREPPLPRQGVLRAYSSSGTRHFSRGLPDHGSNHLGDRLEVDPSGNAIVLARVDGRFFLDAFALPFGSNIWGFEQPATTFGDTFSLRILPSNIAVVGGLESVTKSATWAYDLH